MGWPWEWIPYATRNLEQNDGLFWVSHSKEQFSFFFVLWFPLDCYGVIWNQFFYSVVRMKVLLTYQAPTHPIWLHNTSCIHSGFITMNHIFIYLIFTKLLSLFSSLTIYLILNTYYIHYDNPHNCIYVFNLTYSFQCSSNSSFVSPPTTTTSIDPNRRLYQALRGIKSPEVQISSQVLDARSYSRRGLHLGRFDPSRRLIEPRIWIYAGFKNQKKTGLETGQGNCVQRLSTA